MWMNMSPLIALLVVTTAANTRTHHVPDDFPTIAAAVEAASPGDQILVERGDYEEQVFIDKPLSIDSVSGPYETRLLGSAAGGSIFTCDPGGGRVMIGGFSFINGASERGGAIAAEGLELGLYHCIFDGNVASDGGGAVAVRLGELYIEDCLFIRNRQTSPSGTGGGALWTDVVDALIINTLFRENSAATYGGAAYFGMERIDDKTRYIEIPGVIFSANAATAGGINAANTGAYLDASFAFTYDLVSPWFQCEPGCVITCSWQQDPPLCHAGTDDPGFVDPSSDDYRLVPGSVCEGQGAGDYVGVDWHRPEYLPTDLLGRRRRSGTSGVECGPFETQQTDRCSADCNPWDDDDVVNVLDLGVVLNGSWRGDVAPVYDDFTFGDGVVDVLDILHVLQSWGPCPESE